MVPDCIVVNPKQSDCKYPCSFLCGAGVALKLVQALGNNFLNIFRVGACKQFKSSVSVAHSACGVYSRRYFIRYVAAEDGICKLLLFYGFGS